LLYSRLRLLLIKIMIIEQAKNQRELIVATLSAEKLPVDDLPETLDNFLVATENGQLIGVGGLEIYGAYGLLRSLAVLPGHRNKGVAGKLIERLESLAALRGLKALYLLTETAPQYFAGKAFQKITRDEVPDEVKQSSEFSHVCPVSAIVMKKNIN
jgi:amino-acid N-acetyltransferase